MIERSILDKAPSVQEFNEKKLPLDSQIQISLIYDGDPLPQLVRVDLTGAKNCDMTEYPKAVHCLEKLAKANDGRTKLISWCHVLIAGLRRIETWREQACGAPFQPG